MNAFNSISCQPICFSEGMGSSGAGAAVLAACCCWIFGAHDKPHKIKSRRVRYESCIISKVHFCHEARPTGVSRADAEALRYRNECCHLSGLLSYGKNFWHLYKANWSRFTLTPSYVRKNVRQKIRKPGNIPGFLIRISFLPVL